MALFIIFIIIILRLFGTGLVTRLDGLLLLLGR